MRIYIRLAKTYRVQVAGRPSRSVLEQLRRGVRLAGGTARVESMRVKSHRKESTTLEMRLCEGRNREIRRVLAKVGHKVLKLVISRELRKVCNKVIK